MPPPKVTPLLTAGVPLFSHEGDVESVAFSPDGTTIVASDLRSTTLWNPDSGKARWHTGGGGVAAFLDEESVIVSGYTNQPRIYAAASGDIVAVPPWFASHAIGVPADGGDMALAGHVTLADEKGAGLIVIDWVGATLAAEGEPAASRPTGIGDRVIAKLAASPDGKLLVASEYLRNERTTRAVASRTLEKHWRIDVGGDEMAFSPDGTRLGLHERRGELFFLDPSTGKELARAPQKAVQAFAFSTDGSRIAIATARMVEIVDARSFATMMTLEPFGLAPDARIGALAFSPDGKRLAVGLPDRLTIFELESQKQRGAPAGHARGVWAMALPGEGVVVTRGPRETKTWRIASGELLSTQSRTEEIWPIPALAVTPEGALLDAEPGAIRVKNARGEVAASLEPARPMPLAAGQLLVAPRAGTALAMIPEEGDGGTFSTLRLFDLATLAEIAAPSKLPTGFDFGRPLAISSDGTRIAVPRLDNDFKHTIVVRDAATGELVCEKKSRDVVSLAFLDASRLLVVSPGTVEILTIGAGCEQITVQDASRPSGDFDDDDDGFFASSVTVSPDGRLVAFGSEDDATVHVCEADRWNEAVLCGKRLPVKVLCFSADSRTLAAGLHDGSFRVWSIDL